MSHSPVGHKSTVSKLAESYPNKIFKSQGSEIRRTRMSEFLSKSGGVSEVVLMYQTLVNSVWGIRFQTRNGVFWADFRHREWIS